MDGGRSWLRLRESTQRRNADQLGEAGFEQDLDENRSEIPDAGRDFPGIDRRTRALINLGVLTAMGRTEEIKIYLGAAENVGVYRS